MARTPLVVLAGAALLLTSGCLFHHKPAGATAVATPAQAPVFNGIASSDRVYYDNGSGGIQDSVRMVIRDPAQLAAVWKQATAGQQTPPPAPTVDFTKEMVVLVGAGRQTPDDQIHVDSVGVTQATTAAGRKEETLSVIVRTMEGCHQFRTAAYPVEIVRVRRFDGPVVFVERHEQAANCRP